MQFLTLPIFLSLATIASDAAPPDEASAQAAAPAPVGGPQLLERVVAVFTSAGEGKRAALTLSELEVEARLALVGRGAVEAASAPLPDDTLAASMDWLIAELLLYEEARRLELHHVEPAEVQREVEALQARFPSEEAFRFFLHTHEIARSDLARTARRRLVVVRYLESRIRLGGGVTDDEVESAYQQRRGEMGSLRFEEAKAPLRAQLEKERREAIVANLIRDLRARAGVRILHRFDG